MSWDSKSGEAEGGIRCPRRPIITEIHRLYYLSYTRWILPVFTSGERIWKMPEYFSVWGDPGWGEGIFWNKLAGKRASAIVKK